MELIVAESAPAAARRIAGRITVLARQAIGRRGVCNLALSGGPHASTLYAALVDTEIFWGRVNVFQVDEADAPEGHPACRGNVLVEELADQVGLPPGRLHRIEPGGDPYGAATRYAGRLPERFDVVQLGLDADGVTAGWSPQDPAVLDDPAPVVVGRSAAARRTESTSIRPEGAGGYSPEGAGGYVVTLGPAVVQRAEHRLFLVTGAEHRPVLARLLAGDPALPATRVAAGSTVHADRAAAGPVDG